MTLRRRKQERRDLITLIREQNALIERQTDRILHLAGRPYMPTPRETEFALRANEPVERDPEKVYQALPEQHAT